MARQTRDVRQRGQDADSPPHPGLGSAVDRGHSPRFGMNEQARLSTAVSDARFIDTCTRTISLVIAVILEYRLVYVLAVDAAPEQGRQRGPLPAAGPRCVGSGGEAVEGA